MFCSLLFYSILFFHLFSNALCGALLKSTALYSVLKHWVVRLLTGIHWGSPCHCVWVFFGGVSLFRGVSSSLSAPPPLTSPTSRTFLGWTRIAEEPTSWSRRKERRAPCSCLPPTTVTPRMGAPSRPPPPLRTAWSVPAATTRDTCCSDAAR